MARLKIVGRQEQQVQQYVNPTPGQPNGGQETVTACSLFVQAVDDEGSPVGSVGMQQISIPVTSLDDVAHLTTGTIVELTEV